MAGVLRAGAAPLRAACRDAAHASRRTGVTSPAPHLPAPAPRLALRRLRAARGPPVAGAAAPTAEADATSAPPFHVAKRPKDHRKCVGIVLLNARGQAFVARRADGALLDKGDDGLASGSSLWQFPQGGVDKGEEALDAARRELFEETGVRSAEYLGETSGWLCYQFPAELLSAWRAKGKGWGGKYIGQAQRWFFFRYTAPSDAEVDLGAAHGDPEFCEWRWAAVDDAIVDAVVPFKRAVYAEVVRTAQQLLKKA